MERDFANKGGGVASPPQPTADHFMVPSSSPALLDSVFLTTPPPVELGLEPGDSVFQRLVLLLLFLPLALPLLCGELHVQTHCVLDRLCPGETARCE